MNEPFVCSFPACWLGVPGTSVMVIHVASRISGVPYNIISFLLKKFSILSVFTLMFRSSMNKTVFSPCLDSSTIFSVWKFSDAFIGFLDSLSEVWRITSLFFFFLIECLVSAADVHLPPNQFIYIHLHPLVIPWLCIISLNDTSLLSS